MKNETSHIIDKIWKSKLCHSIFCHKNDNDKVWKIVV